MDPVRLQFDFQELQHFPDQMFYVYVIVSLSTTGRYYIGFTTDVEQRLSGHKRWQKSIHFAFPSLDSRSGGQLPFETEGSQFREIPKRGSGRAFLKKHLL